MKFTIVTPTFNRKEYLAQTIESVLSQRGDFEIEYIIKDAVSTDGTLELAQSYADKVSAGQYPIHCNGIKVQVISVKDRNPAEGYAQGFERATGNILSCLGSDDILLPGALTAIRMGFNHFPEISWLRGRHALMNTTGILYAVQPIHGYYQPWLQRGVYGRNAYWIAAESTFYKRELLVKAGGFPCDFPDASDYALWVRMSRFAPLYSLDAAVVGFRMHESQLSKDTAKYNRHRRLAAPEDFRDKIISAFFVVTNKFPGAFASLVPYLYVLCFGNQHFKFIRFDKNGNSRMTTTALFK